jgi:hypothetical protein
MTKLVAYSRRCRPPVVAAVALLLSAQGTRVSAAAGPATTAPPEVGGPLDPHTTTAHTALTQAIAAYEYGEIEEMVDAARLVSEGRVQPVSPSERAQALRLVGIGLFLLDRRDGAETTFVELLRQRPESRLDPRTTRPDVVAFFELVRQKHDAELKALRPARRGPEAGWLVLLPPAGQFANGETALGLGIATLEVASVATIATTWALLRSWQKPDDTFGRHESDARTLRTVNVVAWGTLFATVIFGVAEAALYKKPAADGGGFAWEPGGIRVRF